MKCPNCGEWNQASLPRCKRCGCELENVANSVPAWQLELDQQAKAKSYIRVDESGEAETTVDPRESLASEMADLKSRKLLGEQKQRQLRQEAARRGMAPSGRTVRTTSNRSTFFSAYDNPDATLRPVAPELVEEGEVEPNARQVYPERYRGSRGDAESYRYRGARHVTNIRKPSEDERVYDSYQDTSAYIPAYARQDDVEHTMRVKAGAYRRKPRRHSGGRRFMRVLLILAALGVTGWLTVAYVLPLLPIAQKEEKPAATVTPTIVDDMAAHTVAIPGEEGQRITIRELRSSAIVTGGVATFEIPDHTWYDTYEDYLQESMVVTLTPYAITESGKQQPMQAIHYEIDVPLSPIELSTPTNPYQVVSTALYNIVFYVREGSTVTINGKDFSDLVDTDGGKVSYNATVQPIGENNFEIVVRSQYCRENSMTVTLYREKQEIPMDLASDIATSTTQKTIPIRGTTLPGAVVKVLSPYNDLDITNTATDGSFSFNAVFETIGNNTIVITADYPGKATTRVEHVVYFVPNIDVYSRAAWPLNPEHTQEYLELMDNIELRKKRSQVYECKGTITTIDTTKPQRAYMNIGTEENPLMVYVENSSKRTWEEGQWYRLYADVYGMYDNKPWLIVRYSYTYDYK